MNATIGNTWYNTSDDNEWYSSKYYSNNIPVWAIYTGYATWHFGGSNKAWRSCLQITIPSAYSSAYRLDSLVLSLKTEEDGSPYHTRAFLSSYGPGGISNGTIYPTGATGFVTTTSDMDSSITDYFKTKYISSAWASKNAEGTQWFDNKSKKGDIVYFTFKNITLSPNSTYYVYMARQDYSCTSTEHDKHGLRGYVNSLKIGSSGTGISATINYSDVVNFNIQQSLDGGTASNFDETYGSITIDLPSISGSLSGGFTVTPGTTFNLTGVSSKTGYIYSGSNLPQTKVINSDDSYTVPFKRRFTVTYDNSLNKAGEEYTEYFNYGDDYKTSYFGGWTAPAGYSFTNWIRTSDNEPFGEKYNCGKDGIIPSGHSSATPIILQPQFGNNKYKLTYYEHGEDKSYTVDSTSQEVEYYSQFSINAVGIHLKNTHKYSVTGWKIGDTTIEDATTPITYSWTENKSVYPVVSGREYKLKYTYDGNTSPDVSVVYGSNFIEVLNTWKNSIVLPSHKKIVGWKTSDNGITVTGNPTDWESIHTEKDGSYKITMMPIIDDDVKIIVYDNTSGTRTPTRVKMYRYEDGNGWIPLCPYVF